MMSEQNEKKWYVVRAVSGKEKKVKEYLDAEIARRADLQGLISQVLIPTEKVFSVRNGKKISKERNYLPGYVLIEAVLNGEVSHVIKNTPNVLGFLGTKGEADPLRREEVSRILGKVDELAESGEGSDLTFIVGETVVVNDGPFSSFSGIIEEVNAVQQDTGYGLHIDPLVYTQVKSTLKAAWEATKIMDTFDMESEFKTNRYNQNRSILKDMCEQLGISTSALPPRPAASRPRATTASYTPQTTSSPTANQIGSLILSWLFVIAIIIIFFLVISNS